MSEIALSRKSRSWRNAPRADLGLEIAVGRGDEAHVDRARLEPADAHARLRSSSTRSSLAWSRRRELADLVEEHGAAVGGLEQAGLGWRRAGERALLVAEQLALEQRLGAAPRS